MHAGGNDLVNKNVWNSGGSAAMVQYLEKKNVMMQEDNALRWAGEDVSVGTGQLGEDKYPK